MNDKQKLKENRIYLAIKDYYQNHQQGRQQSYRKVKSHKTMNGQGFLEFEKNNC